MPTVNYFPDPRLQAVADYASVLQYQRLQSEIRNQEREARERQIYGQIGGAALGAVGGFGVGKLTGASTAEAAAAGIQGASVIPQFILGGAEIGAGIGGAIGGGDISGGIQAALQGAGQAVQGYQDVQQYGFLPSPLDKKEISKLATSLNTTTQALTTQWKAEAPEIPLGQWAAQLAQQQAEARMQNVFQGQTAQALGVAPELIQQAGGGDTPAHFQAGAERIRRMRQDQRLEQREAELRQRLMQTAEFEAKQETHDLVLNDEPAEEAVRYWNAVVSPSAGLDKEQQLQLMERVVTDAEKQRPKYKWVQKQPPDPATIAQRYMGQMQPVIEQLRTQGFTGFTFSYDKEGQPRLSVSMGIDTGDITPKDLFDMTLTHQANLSRARVIDVPVEEALEDIRKTAEQVGVSLPSPPSAEPVPAPQAPGQAATPQVAPPEAQEIPTAEDVAQATIRVEVAVRNAPNIDTWTPQEVEARRDDARTLARSYEYTMKNRRLTDEENQTLDMVERILEQ